MKAKELTDLLDGKLEGDPDAEFTHPVPIDKPEPGGVAILIDPKREKEGELSVLITKVKPSKLNAKAVIYVDDPESALIKTLSLFVEDDFFFTDGIHPRAVIHTDAQISKDVSIGPFTVVSRGVHIGKEVKIGTHVFIGPGVKIGDQVVVYPFVYLGAGTVIGNRVVIYPGAVIGRPGFGFFRKGGKLVRIPQVGRVVIEDDCEIGANTCIDRASIGETRIGKGTKIDNLVQIAHNVVIGQDTVIAGQTGLAGNVKVGNRVTMAGQVGIADHKTIGDDAILTAQAGITSNVPHGAIYSGHYARERKEFLKAQTLFYRLPELFETVKKIKRLLNDTKTDNPKKTD